MEGRELVGGKVGASVGRTVGVPVGWSVRLHITLFPAIGTNPTLHVHTYAAPPDGAAAQYVVSRSHPWLCVIHACGLG